MKILVAVDGKPASAAALKAAAQLTERLNAELAVVTVRSGAREAFEAALAGSIFARIGEVIPAGVLRIDGLQGHRIIETDLAALKAAWQKPLGV